MRVKSIVAIMATAAVGIPMIPILAASRGEVVTEVDTQFFCSEFGCSGGASLCGEFTFDLWTPLGLVPLTFNCYEHRVP